VVQTPLLHLIVVLLGVFSSVAVSTSTAFSRQAGARNFALGRLLARSARTQSVQHSIVQDRPLEQTMEAICQLIEHEIVGAKVTMMRCNEDRPTLTLVASTGGISEEFREKLIDLPILEGVGACGTAAARGDLVISSDIRNDAKWTQYLKLTDSMGFRACWSFPALARSGKVLGTLAIYLNQPAEPNAAELTLAHEACTLLSLALEVEAERNALKLSEQRYNSLFNEHPDAVYLLDREGHVISLNSKARRAFNGELIGVGTHYSVFVPAKHLPGAQDYFTAALKGDHQHYEIYSTTGVGRGYYTDVTHLPMLVNGEVCGVFGIVKDITARKLAEEQLHVLRRSVDASINGIMIVDARKPDLPIEFLNSTFEDITGYSIAESLGRNSRFLQGPGTDRAAVARIKAALERKKEYQETL
ncbi:MAG: PAS domain S-box protein, partial [Natronospirillum sp.]